jgi:hypothetical protein
VVSAGSRIFLDLTRVLRHPIFGRVLPVIAAHVYAASGGA